MSDRTMRPDAVGLPRRALRLASSPKMIPPASRTSTLAAMDTVAERITALGGTAYGTLATVMRDASLTPLSG